MKTRKRCDANHANRCHSARCGVTSFFYSAALRCALSRWSSLMSLPVRMMAFHPREYLVRRCSKPRRFMQRATAAGYISAMCLVISSVR